MPGNDNTCELDDLTGSNDANKDLRNGLKVASNALKIQLDE